MIRDRQGQSVLELALSVSVASLVITGAGWLVRAQWERGRCAYLVFETTHARLAGAFLPKGGAAIRIFEESDRITGEGRCGDATEQVSLPRLEAARW